jgi:GNAT superfamily N-acetyltransferase
MPATSPDRFQLRPAAAPDLPGILDCLQRAFEPVRSEYTAEAYLHTVLDAELARERLGSMHVLVAVTVEPPPVVGTLSWTRTSPESAHLRGMAVRPEFQGSGVAQRLLDRALSEAREAGVRRVTLRTTAPLARAIRFYERNGFRPSGTVADFHGMRVTERVREL